MINPFRSAILVLSASALIGCTLLERPESFYSSMPEALADGAVPRGWIPEWIPSSAREIKEIHDLDTNESMLAFEIPTGQPWQLPAHCQPIHHSQIGQPRFSRPWWPSTTEQARSYVFHRCNGDDPSTPKFVWVGRHKSGKFGLHWRAYSL